MLRIRGVGWEFHRGMGTCTHRTGGAMTLACSVEDLVAVLRHNILAACEDPHHCVRLMVQGSRYWYTRLSAETVFESVVCVATDAASARALRRYNPKDAATPVSVCVCEALPPADDGAPRCLAQWMFRHDVIDGWRSVRYLFPLVWSSHTLTFDRLRGRSRVPAVTSRLYDLSLLPVVLAKVRHVVRGRTRTFRNPLHLHMVCSLAHVKSIARHYGAGLTDTLGALLVEAYFAADPSLKCATLANAVLFNMDASHGNRVCIRACTVPRKDRVGILAHLTTRSQRLTDRVMMAMTRLSVSGQLPSLIAQRFHSAHRNLDLLVSSMPGVDACVPRVVDLHVCRETSKWTPNIVYCVGVEDRLYLDFYWRVRDTFATQRFLQVLQSTFQPDILHTKLPQMY